MRIVLVDDNQAVRETFAARVAAAGHEIVGQADDGQAGVESALKLRPDIVITNWRMPVLHGIEATKQIRDSAPEVVVIALTSSADASVRDAFVRAGAEACIDMKDMTGLLDTLREVECRRR
jgi:DNA-binding NarL/FixJ family response regulator